MTWTERGGNDNERGWGVGKRLGEGVAISVPLCSGETGKETVVLRLMLRQAGFWTTNIKGGGVSWNDRGQGWVHWKRKTKKLRKLRAGKNFFDKGGKGLVRKD